MHANTPDQSVVKADLCCIGMMRQWTGASFSVGVQQSQHKVFFIHPKEGIARLPVGETLGFAMVLIASFDFTKHTICDRMNRTFVLL